MSKPIAGPSYRQILANAQADPKAKIFVVNNRVRLDRAWSISRMAGWLSADLRQQRQHMKASTIESYLAAVRAEFPALRGHMDPTLTVLSKMQAHRGASLRGSFITELDADIRRRNADLVREAAQLRVALEDFPAIFNGVCAGFEPITGSELAGGTPRMENDGWMRRLGAMHSVLVKLADNAYWLRREPAWQTIGSSSGLKRLVGLLDRPIGGSGMFMPLHKWSDAANVRQYFERLREHEKHNGVAEVLTPDEFARQINAAMRDCRFFGEKMFGAHATGGVTPVHATRVPGAA